MNTGTSAIVWASIVQKQNKEKKAVKVEQSNNSSIVTGAVTSKKEEFLNV